MLSKQQYISDAEKVKFLKYTLSFIQPLLQQFHQEQCQEVELEVKLRGMLYSNLHPFVLLSEY